MATPYPVSSSSSSSFSSSSSSSATLPRKYQFFLSFTGRDVRKGFLDHLDAALRQNGLSTFKDDRELERGRAIYEGIQEAIQQSQSSIVVFSKNYAASTDCLDELVLIHERMKREKWFKVFPVFYHVNPTDVQKLRGAYGEAFVKHDQEFTSSPLKVSKWRVATMEVAEVSGWELLQDVNESNFIQGIVQEILCHSMRKPIDVAIEATCGGMAAGINDKSPQETSNRRTDIRRLCCIVFLPHFFASILIIMLVLFVIWIVFRGDDRNIRAPPHPFGPASAPI